MGRERGEKDERNRTSVNIRETNGGWTTASVGTILLRRRIMIAAILLVMLGVISRLLVEIAGGLPDWLRSWMARGGWYFHGCLDFGARRNPFLFLSYLTGCTRSLPIVPSPRCVPRSKEAAASAIVCPSYRIV